jgi:hypothetical protein
MFSSLIFCYLQFCCLYCDSAKFNVLDCTVSSACDHENFKVKCVELTELQNCHEGCRFVVRKGRSQTVKTVSRIAEKCRRDGQT